jgi:cyclophilin family peptidyl-prolyl cis-trans isomerase
LQGLASQIQGKQAGAWALYLAATSAAENQEYEEAKKALVQLRTQYPAHPLLTEKKVFSGAEGAQTPAGALEARVDAQIAWRTAHASLFTNPELPADSPRVKVHTDKGDIVLGLYAAEAPKHVENFLKLAREGYYNGVKFHRVVPGFMVQSGDPNTITGDPTTWGPGGPDYKIPREENKLKHLTGVLAMAKKPSDVDSSGSQFYITVAPAHHLDGKHVVFGKVVEGMDVIREIERSPIAAKTQDRPENPVVIQSMEVLGG